MSKRQSSILAFLGTKDENSSVAINNSALPSTPDSVKSKHVPTKQLASSSPFPIPTSPLQLNEDKDSDERYEWLVNIRDSQGRLPSASDYDSSTLFIPQTQWKKFTPFEKQFWEIKSNHYDSVVFFKKGKFYELYENDADIGASLFDLKVADRVNMKMAGVPEASFTFWAAKFKVVKVDQSENSIAKQIRKRVSSTIDEPSIITRTVTAVLSRGTLVDPAMSSDTDYSFCAFILIVDNEMDICLADISLGVYATATQPFSSQHCTSLFMKFNPKELIMIREQRELLIDVVRSFANIQVTCKAGNDIRCAKDLMFNHFNDMMLGDLNSSLREIDLFRDSCSSVNLSGELLESLDIFSANPKKKTLWRHLNRTITAAGRRKLLKWLIFPSSSRFTIEGRQAFVANLLKDSKLLELVCDFLKRIPDIERLRSSAKYSSNPESILKEFLSGLLSVKEFIAYLRSNGIQVNCNYASLEFLDNLPCGDLERSILDDDATLKLLLEERVAVERQLEEYRLQYSKALKAEASFKHVGKEHFLIEFPTNVKTGPEFLTMSKTKTHARYWTPSVKGLATEHDEVSEKIRGRSECLLRDFLDQLCAQKEHIDILIDISAEWDCYQSLAKFSRSLGPTSCLPSFTCTDYASLCVSDMKHPLFVDDPNYIANDVAFSPDSDSNLMILTGPNMGGKSTFMKQLASVVILAQIGSCVPASSYKGSIFNRILSRIGAEDNILGGRSTFMVELDDVSKMLSLAREQNEPTLLIVDEFGRGTSTYDGIALASSVVNELRRPHLVTIFSTHFRSVPQSMTLKGARKFMSFTDVGEKIVFQYKLVDGISPSSFALAAALRAGISQEILEEAKMIGGFLDTAEKPNLDTSPFRLAHLLTLLPNKD